MKTTTILELKKLLQEEEVRLKKLRERVKRYRKKKEKNQQLDIEDYLNERQT